MGGGGGGGGGGKIHPKILDKLRQNMQKNTYPFRLVVWSICI